MNKLIRLKGEPLEAGRVWYLEDNRWVEIPLEPSLKVYNHSPTGFAWGYSGSGPAQLALAILLTFASEDKAIMGYQRFKKRVIAALPYGKPFEEEIDIGPYI